MMQKLLLLFSLILTAYTAQAQLPPACDPGPPIQEPAEDCESACIYCNFNNQTFNTGNYTGGSVPIFCSQIQNDMWLGFIAQSSSATFTITPNNCVNGNGVQVALYGGCGENWLGCNGGAPGNGGNPVSITVNMVPGTNYFLLIDGYSGDVCDVTIQVSPPQNAPTVGPIQPIQGPGTVCPGATVTYSVPNVTGAGAYTWTAPPGALINGEPSPLTLDAPDGRTVQVTFGATGGQVCVQADNSCYSGPTTCRNIIVQPIPVTNLPRKIYCFEDQPYLTDWGEEVFASGTPQVTIPSYQGCDSTIRQQIVVKPPITTNLNTRYICEGGMINVCGVELDATGPINVTCESYQGCDSLVIGSLVVLDPVAEITTSGTITCTTSSVVLNSAPSVSGTQKVWRNLANGQTVGVGNSVTVTQAGTYVLTSRITLGGTTCEKTDTVTITVNNTPPTATATTAGFLGCTTTTVQLNVNTNASGATYAWGGPGGFTSNLPNPIATVGGVYTVTVTNPSNGCSATSTATVQGNTNPPSASATGGTVTCALPQVTLNSTTNASPANYVWAGPGGFNSTIANPTANASGTYTVTITDPANGCSATATASISQNTTAPSASTSVSGPIGCVTPNVSINVATNGSTPGFAWTGPNGFTSTVQSPSVAEAGTYSVVVTDGVNGCTAAASVVVTGNVNLPDVSAAGGTVSCGTQSISLSGNSTTPGVTYAWSGPGGFTSNQPNPSATAVGIYTLVVTAPNTCTSSASATVGGDFVAPQASATGGTISCSAANVSIQGSSTTPGATFAWSGPGNFSSTNATENVSATGTYILTVTAPNGCTTTATADVVPDAGVPNISASSNTLTCAVTSVLLDGNSTTPGVNFTWTGPGGFNASIADTTVTVPGTYTLVVSDPNNGCTASAPVTVNLNNTNPDVQATGGTLTCASPNFTLQGNSSTSGVTWAWTGPAGFTSTDQNPSITIDGNYVLVVTNPTNGCTSSATALVQADQNAPQATTTTGELTCAITSITLNGGSNIPVTYAWSGPNSFSSSSQTPSVTEPGTYILTVTAANGCTDVETSVVTQDIAAPVLTSTGGTITCNDPQIPISVSTTAPSPTFIWSGPNGFSSNISNPTAPEPGPYNVTVTGANGCNSVAIINVADDTETPDVQTVAPTVLTCAVLNSGIQTTIDVPTSPVQTISWTGPGGFTSTDEDPSVTAPGVYNVVVTSQNGCTGTSAVTVQQDIVAPDASATSGTLTCAVTSLPLNGGSTTNGSSFSWSGPGGFTSALEDPTVAVNGPYVLTVTGPNGCTSTVSTTVQQDIVEPGATAASSNILDCDDLTTTLQGNSATAGVTYAWSGPGVNANQQNTSASQPGIYTLTTQGTNGCTSTATVQVDQDIVAPNASAVGDTIDCISGQAVLTGGSTTPGATFAWSGPNGFNSPQQTPTVSVDGNYLLTVTGPNGCTSTATTAVAENTQSPQVELTGGGILTCAVTTLDVTGTISTPGAIGVWSTGSTNSTIAVTNPGTLTYTVTAPNGCISAPSITVNQDIQAPQAVTAVGGQIDCNFPTITINGSTSTNGVNYSWTGPGGYISTQQNPNDISQSGNYVLVVTNPINGCTSSASATVTLDPTVPDIAAATNTLTCAITSVVLDATSTSSNVTYQWSGPNAFSSTQEDPSTSTPGTYTVVAKATSSGCTASATVVVPQDIAPPGASAVGNTITCTLPSVSISGTSPAQGVLYAWSGPGGFTSSAATPNVNVPGNYLLTITGTNGCTSTAVAVVNPDVNLPQVTTTGNTITCAIPSVNISASANVSVNWSWTGPGGFTSTQANNSVTAPGSYTVVATAANGCSVTAAAEVAADVAPPVILTQTPNELNCTTTQVSLNAAVQGSGVFTYAWTGGNIVSGANSQSPVVSLAGPYTVVVTNTQNGCSAQQIVTVPINNDVPSAAVRNVRDVSCFGDTNGSISITNVTGGTPPLVYSINGGQTFNSSPSFTNLSPNSYDVVIQDVNGCELMFSVVIDEPEELIVNLGLDTTIHLGNSLELSLNDVVNIPERVKQQIVTPAGFLTNDSLITPIYSFRYTVTVLDSNGCRASDDRLVIVDRTRKVYVPNIFTPEGENSENQIFRIYGGEDVAEIKSFRVYNRWGEEVHNYFNFLPDSPAHGWDGTVRGKKVTPAVYVWYAEILFKDGLIELFKGDVTLMR